MNYAVILNLIAALFLLASIVTVIILAWKKKIYFRAGMFLLFCLLIILFVAVGNVLEHSGILRGMDIIEEYLEILIVPYFLLFVYSVVSRREFNAIREREAALSKSLEERAVLFKEVHHRVKNNLQVVASLISLQSEREKNKIIQSHMTSLQNRIMSMAALHVILYKTSSLTRIYLADYVEEILQQIQLSYDPDKGIHIEKLFDPVRIDLDTALPCGLIINEILTNSVKHAFDQGDYQNRKITITVKQKDPEQLFISICDNGSGFTRPEKNGSAGLGMSIITSLIDQLQGTYEIQSGKGTCFEFTFPYKSDPDEIG